MRGLGPALARVSGRGIPSKFLVVLSTLAFVGCATPHKDGTDRRQEAVEKELRAWGIEDDPAVEEQRAEVQAAIAAEDEVPVLDSIEVRATAMHERDDKLQMQARLPLDNLFTAAARREAREAKTQVEIAQLSEVALQQRVLLCQPSLDRLVYAEHADIYGRYELRQNALLEWNQEMRTAGLLDEVSAERFELSTHVSLARSIPAPPAPDSALDSTERPVAVLPTPSPSDLPLNPSVDIIREQLLLNHPGVGVHRARGKNFQALAQRERTERYPTLRFVEFGFEPTAYPGDKREYDAQFAFEIPFGRSSAASESRFRALAHGQRSAERALIERSIRQTQVAIERINQFRRRGQHWLTLLGQADAAEELADGRLEDRVASPKAITKLLDEIYDARMAVLQARERAGEAACDVLATTGLSVNDWPL